MVEQYYYDGLTIRGLNADVETLQGEVETLRKRVGELEGENTKVKQSLRTTDGLLLKTQEHLNIALRDK